MISDDRSLRGPRSFNQGQPNKAAISRIPAHSVLHVKGLRLKLLSYFFLIISTNNTKRGNRKTKLSLSNWEFLYDEGICGLKNQHKLVDAAFSLMVLYSGHCKVLMTSIQGIKLYWQWAWKSWQWMIGQYYTGRPHSIWSRIHFHLFRTLAQKGPLSCHKQLVHGILSCTPWFCGLPP